jgi:hypothetical protein
MFRTFLTGVVVLAAAGAAAAQQAQPKKADPIPAPRPAPPSTPAAPAAPAPAIITPDTYTVSPGTIWAPYTPQRYPVPGQIVVVPGNAYAYLPARAVYGPAASPLDYPYHAFVPGYPYPGYTMINPYPRTVSSYSYGPSTYPPTGRLFRR